MSAPLRTAYARGRALEYRVAADLAAAGYRVKRSPASKGDGDLWAVRSRGLWGLVFLLFVQVKRARSAFSTAEWNALYEAAESVHGYAILATAELRGPLRYYRLTALREPGSRDRPWEEFSP